MVMMMECKCIGQTGGVVREGKGKGQDTEG
jgi:hypothetical protein